MDQNLISDIPQSLPPILGQNTDNQINTVHTLFSDIMLIQLSLEKYGTENLFTATHTSLYQDTTVQFDASSGIDLTTFETPHKHNYFELMLVLDGEIDMSMEGSRLHYTRGDLCLLNRNTKHNEEFRGDSQSVWKRQPGFCPPRILEFKI